MELIAELLIVCLVLAGIHLYRKEQYKQTEYYQSTRVPYGEYKKDPGKYGEWLVYEKLKGIVQPRRFLFNCYLPREDGTTEADVILIHPVGIFVFESKNYSGWIFGGEKNRMWTQTLPNGKGRSARKEKFSNPIMQNKLHISQLNKQLAEYKDLPYYSVIVFSDHCDFKKVDVSLGTAVLVHSAQLAGAVKQIATQKKQVLSERTIERIYQKLYPYTQVSENVKKRHIEEIQRRISQREGECAVQTKNRKRSGQQVAENLQKDVKTLEKAGELTVEEYLASEEKFQEVMEELQKPGERISMNPLKKAEGEEAERQGNAVETKLQPGEETAEDCIEAAQGEMTTETEEDGPNQCPQEKTENPEEKASEPVSRDRRCPLCGAPLVKRMARRGVRSGMEFWGCSGFPQCKYTENISPEVLQDNNNEK